MINEPNPGTRVLIENQGFSFDGISGYPDIVYAEVGRKAKVYRIRKTSTDQLFGLKVFYKEFRDSKKDQERLNQVLLLGNIFNSKFPTEHERRTSGISTASRSIIIPEQNPSLVKMYPQFSFSLLMNWISGEAWSNMILNKQPISSENSTKLAHSLASVLVGLERRGFSHCDLSGGNLLFSKDFSHVELIDIEEMYWPGRSIPNPIPAGTEGYVPFWVQQKGLWNPYTDRIAGAIILCEILSWRFNDIRSCRADTSFFVSKEFGKVTDRYQLMAKRLADISSKIRNMFDLVWFNKIDELCSLSEWENAIEEL